MFNHIIIQDEDLEQGSQNESVILKETAVQSLKISGKKASQYAINDCKMLMSEDNVQIQSIDGQKSIYFLYENIQSFGVAESNQLIIFLSNEEQMGEDEEDQEDEEDEEGNQLQDELIETLEEIKQGQRETMKFILLLKKMFKQKKSNKLYSNKQTQFSNQIKIKMSNFPGLDTDNMITAKDIDDNGKIIQKNQDQKESESEEEEDLESENDNDSQTEAGGNNEKIDKIKEGSELYEKAKKMISKSISKQ